MTEIEVYADIWCPFTHVGLRAVARRRSELGRDDVAIHVRSWPLELVNHAPLDVATTAQHIAELREQVDAGLFAGFDRNHFPRTTLPALALAAAAYRLDSRTGEALSLDLREALFEQGRDVSREDVLSSVARAHGLDLDDVPDVDEVLAEWHEGETRGVKGSPHFFCGSVDSFCPSLVIGRDEAGRIRIERDMEALGTFMKECFASR